MSLTLVASNRAFGGTQFIYRHASSATGTDMQFAAYLPPQAEHGPCPALIFLSGLTCSEENATVKAGYQRVAAELGMIVVAPDTSPRGEGVANDERYFLGQAASFYLNATQQPWAQHFQMERYIAQELYDLVLDKLPIQPGKIGITGHSMGGHGALTLAMRHPERFASLSAFAPVVAPSQVEWGEVAFSAYLGADRAAWAEHDACALVLSRGWKADMLIDQGDADAFLDTNLRTPLFEAACKQAGQAATIRMQAGYDHSYYFVASFIEEHMRWHAERLG
jgi:S-formylglutathione hydrolase